MLTANEARLLGLRPANRAKLPARTGPRADRAVHPYMGGASVSVWKCCHSDRVSVHAGNPSLALRELWPDQSGLGTAEYCEYSDCS